LCTQPLSALVHLIIVVRTVVAGLITNLGIVGGVATPATSCSLQFTLAVVRAAAIRTLTPAVATISELLLLPLLPSELSVSLLLPESPALSPPALPLLL
jgi:hypothetical protein